MGTLESFSIFLAQRSARRIPAVGSLLSSLAHPSRRANTALCCSRTARAAKATCRRNRCSESAGARCNQSRTKQNPIQVGLVWLQSKVACQAASDGQSSRRLCSACSNRQALRCCTAGHSFKYVPGFAAIFAVIYLSGFAVMGNLGLTGKKRCAYIPPSPPSPPMGEPLDCFYKRSP